MEKKSAVSTSMKISSIAMIVFGILGVIPPAINASLLDVPALAEQNTAANRIAIILAIAGFMMALIAGIMGVKYTNRPEKARACLFCGLLVILLCVLSCIISKAAGGAFSDNIPLLCLILPLEFVEQAFVYQKAAGSQNG